MIATGGSCSTWGRRSDRGEPGGGTDVGRATPALAHPPRRAPETAPALAHTPSAGSGNRSGTGPPPSQGPRSRSGTGSPPLAGPRNPLRHWLTPPRKAPKPTPALAHTPSQGPETHSGTGSHPLPGPRNPLRHWLTPPRRAPETAPAPARGPSHDAHGPRRQSPGYPQPSDASIASTSSCGLENCTTCTVSGPNTGTKQLEVRSPVRCW